MQRSHTNNGAARARCAHDFQHPGAADESGRRARWSARRSRRLPRTATLLALLSTEPPRDAVVHRGKTVFVARDFFGVVRVTQFQEHTGETLAKSIETLFKQNEGPMKGIVLDLRNDSLRVLVPGATGAWSRPRRATMARRPCSMAGATAATWSSRPFSS